MSFPLPELLLPPSCCGHCEPPRTVSSPLPEPGVDHVVPVPNVSNLEALDATLLLDDGHDVSHDLCALHVCRGGWIRLV